ncbi:MAG: DUF308 domain-containing protein [Thermomicrobiales bacterium]
MAERALSMAQDHAPWRAGTPWWVTGIQGVVVILIGLYLLLAPASAGGLIVLLIALILLIQSVLHIAAGLRVPRGEVDPYVMLQAGIGATVGLLLVLRGWLVPTLDARSALTILGLGLLAYGVVGGAAALFGRDASEAWLGPVVNALLVIALAVVLLTSTESNAVDRLALLGWIALIGGAVLLFLAWRAHNQPAA